MKAQHKTFTLTQLIHNLQAIKKELKDKGVDECEVLLSTDEEGNSFGTIQKVSFGFDDEENTLTIYPCEEIYD